MPLLALLEEDSMTDWPTSSTPVHLTACRVKRMLLQAFTVEKPLGLLVVKPL